jgi:hypothetical protein
LHTQRGPRCHPRAVHRQLCPCPCCSLKVRHIDFISRNFSGRVGRLVTGYTSQISRVAPVATVAGTRAFACKVNANRPAVEVKTAEGKTSRHTSHVTRHASRVTRHTSHATRHTSHATRHTPHVTRHASRVTRHTLHVTSHLAPSLAAVAMVMSSKVTKPNPLFLSGCSLRNKEWVHG